MASPLGEISLVMSMLRQQFIDSATFVAQCAIDSLTPADQIFYHALRPEKEGNVDRPTALARPFILIKCEQFTYNDFTVECMAPQCTMRVRMTDDARDDDFQEAALLFTNFYGSVLQDISKTAYMDRRLVIRKISQVMDPTPVKRTEQSPTFDFWCVEFDFEIGARLGEA